MFCLQEVHKAPDQVERESVGSEAIMQESDLRNFYKRRFDAWQELTVL